MSSLRALCPAKVNLGLEVLGRRPDGFHEIVTIFQAIDVNDTLDAELADEVSLEVSGAILANDESNLVKAAARLVQSRIDGAKGLGARLTLHKTIPVGGGLGGGSSDAAGALVLLNQLWGLGLNAPEMMALAAELGSDAPFFLAGGTALGTGRGATIRPLRPIRERLVLLGFPPFGLSTAEVYGALGAPLTADGTDVTVPRLFVKLAEGNDFSLVRNDLERPAFALRRDLEAFRDELSLAGAEVSLLSGSGSTVFGLFGTGMDPGSIVSSLENRFPGWVVRVSRTMGSGVRIVPAVR